jgi:uncharacterized protein YecT (DUF1311 family)
VEVDVKVMNMFIGYAWMLCLAVLCLIKMFRCWVGSHHVVSKLIVVFIISSFSLVSSAEDACVESASSVQIAKCAEAEMKKADENLNESYKAVIERASSRYIFQYQSQPEINKAFLGKLKDSQRAWIKLRDTNCLLEGFENEWDKVSYAADMNRCIARMSLERAKYLDAIIPSR